MLETAHNHGLGCQKIPTDTSFLTANMSYSAFAESKTMETFHLDMSKVAHGRVLVSQNGAESYRGQSSWSVVLRGGCLYSTVVMHTYY